MDMDISMDIHAKSVDMYMDMDEKFLPRQPCNERRWSIVAPKIDRPIA